MANKKINQLVSKTAILSTDIFGIGDATTGQLFKKTIAELQAAIGGAVISVNGLVGTVVLDTDDIQELATPTNKYFTDARARGAISLTVTGNSGASTYSSGTGVLNVPTYTLAGLGGITATFLSGTSGISYNSATGVISYSGTVYTDASIRALFSGGTGISYNSSTGAISYSGTVYTDSSVRALISMTTTGDSGASTYNNTTGVINVPNYTLAGLGGISLTSLSGSGSVSYNNTTGVISSTITQYTDALARASVSLTTTGTSGASTYNSTTGVFNIPQYQAVLTNPVTGTGTSGHVAYWNGSGSIAGSANHFWDNTNGRLGIGTSSPADIFHISKSSTSSWDTYFENTNNTASNGIRLIFRTIDSGANTLNAGGIRTVFNSRGASTVDNDIIISTRGTDNIIVAKNNGNVGIGTTSPGCNLDIFGAVTSTYFNLRITDSASMAANVGGGIALSGKYTSAGDTTDWGFIKGMKENGTSGDYGGYINFYTRPNGGSFAERMRITSAGIVNLYSPTTNADALNLYNSSGKLNIKMGGGGGGANQSSLSMYNSANTLTIGLNGAGDTDPSFITGYLAIGTTTNSGYRLYVSGTIYATGNITANSDLTLKKNLAIIENPTDKLMQLNGYAYQWKSDDSHQYGVIAQEVEKILPYAVSTGTDGIKGVSYNQIIPVLIEAVKEQKKELEELRNILASK